MNVKKLAILGGFSLVLAWVLAEVRKVVISALPTTKPLGKTALMLIEGAMILGALFVTAAAFRALKFKAPSL